MIYWKVSLVNEFVGYYKSETSPFNAFHCWHSNNKKRHLKDGEICIIARKKPQTVLGSAIFLFAIYHTWKPFHRLIITARTWKGNETTDSSKPARAVKPHLHAQNKTKQNKNRYGTLNFNFEHGAPHLHNRNYIVFPVLGMVPGLYRPYILYVSSKWWKKSKLWFFSSPYIANDWRTKYKAITKKWHMKWARKKRSHFKKWLFAAIALVVFNLKRPPFRCKQHVRLGCNRSKNWSCTAYRSTFSATPEVSAPLKFWLPALKFFHDRCVYRAIIVSAVPENCQYGDKILGCPTSFFGTCKWGSPCAASEGPFFNVSLG